MKAYIFLIVPILFIIGCTSPKRITNGTIYKRAENKTKLDSMYNKSLVNWPVPYEILDIQTKYGKTSIIASGNVKNPPIFLIPAMGLTATIWLPMFMNYASRTGYMQ